MPEQPDPGPDPGPDADDAEFEEWAAWLDREEAAGRDPFPPEREPDQGISISLGDATSLDPALLAAICGPGGLGGEGLAAQFGQDAAADVLAPSPVLAALAEEAVDNIDRLSDSQMVGVLQAERRLECRGAWRKARVIAAFARRRAAELEAAAARGVPVHCRPGQFPGEELTAELVVSPVQASHAIDDATDLATRLPRTLAGMEAGLIDEDRAGIISLHTRCLTPEDAALADGILAALAPTLRLDQLTHKARALEMKLDPEAVRARKERARRTRQRVEVRREDSGNASVAGREMDNADALASKAYIDALAVALRRAGVAGTLDQLRLAVFADLTAGRDPLDRVTRPAPAGSPNPGSSPESPSGPGPSPASSSSGPAAGDTCPGSLDYDHDGDNYDDDYDDSGEALASPPARPPAPMPATINLLVPAGTLFGWDTTPAEAGGWGLLDADETRDTVQAASRHPATRWCVTFLRPDGTAATHGCSPGQHPWPPEQQHDKPPEDQDGNPPGRRTPEEQPGGPPDGRPPGRRTPTQDQAAWLAAFLSSLNITPEHIARGSCDHTAAERRYTPSRKLAHLVRARTATCDGPACAAQAIHADLDHTTPYPDGPSDQCNLGPKCRRHHKAKQAPGWKVEQPEPGVIRWTLPSGRIHTTRPTVYDA